MRRRKIRGGHACASSVVRSVFLALVDLVLEPVAYYTRIWIWLEPYTPQVYFGSTIANALVWGGMCLIGIKLWERKGRVEGSVEGVR